MIQLAHWNDTIMITSRQKNILSLIAKNADISSSDITEALSSDDMSVSRITVIRDLNSLVKQGILKRTGKGRSVTYTIKNFLICPFDVEEYFERSLDWRYPSPHYLDFKSAREFARLVSFISLRKIESATKQFQKRFKKYKGKVLDRELQRLTIEFTWKSSQIEGNTYTLLDTERLLIQKKEAPGKTHEEAVMILNHKSAIDYIFSRPRLFKKITPHLIKSIHQLVISNLNVKTGFRKHGVGITGTAYKPFDNEFQIVSAMENLCRLVNKIEQPFVKALIVVAGISYIQPFEDGNKRTARLVGNALLYANDYCPVSYRSVSEIEYKKAIILFYEQHSLEYFMRLFTEQYLEGAEIYFP